MTCQLIVNQLTVGHSWPKVFVNDFCTLMGGGGGKCFVPNAGLMHGSTRPVTTSSHRQLPRQVQPSLGVGNCLKKSCPRGMRVGQIKNNFLLFCKLCVISCAVCTKLQNSRPHIFKGKC